jgi:transcription elongation factor GreA
MNIVSPEEMETLKAKLEELRKAKVDVQDRITKAAALGDLSENAEYHFAKEENRVVERELKALEEKIRGAQVVKAGDIPDDMVFLGHTVKLMDLSDETEQLVKLVGEAVPPSADSDILPVSATSPLGEALMKARIGDTVKVRAPGGSMEFKILEIV